jgi:hypothetical protein
VREKAENLTQKKKEEKRKMKMALGMDVIACFVAAMQHHPGVPFAD